MADKIKSAISISTKLGTRLILSVLLVIFLFGISNIALFIYSLFHFSETSNLLTRITASGGILVLGILFTIFAGYYTYKYLIIYGLSLVYPHLNPFFVKVCLFVVKRFNSAGNMANIKHMKVNKVLDTSDILNETYEKKTPWIIRKCVSFVIGMIPFVSILNQLNIKEVLRSGDTEEAARVLHTEVDKYIRTEIFGSNTIKWLFVAFAVNMVAQATIIYFV